MDFVDDHFALAGGIIAAVIAVLAWVGERRRKTRRDPDAVGLMPWMALCFWSSFAAVLLLGATVKDWLGHGF